MNPSKNQKKRFFLFFLLLLIFFLGAGFILAQEKELEVKGYPMIPGAEAPADIRTPLPQYFKYVFNLLLSLVGLFIFGVLVYGGFRYLTSGHSPVKLADAKKQIFAALLGLIIILSSYLILYTINPQLVIFRIPEWVRVELPPFVRPLPPLEEQTLYAKEIPTAKLIDGTGKEVESGSETSPFYVYEGVLASTRLERIKKLSEEIWETSKRIQEISKEISDASKKVDNLVRSGCVASNCRSNCGGLSEGCPCNCRGDICRPVRKEIMKQQSIINTKLAELPPLKRKLEKLKPKLELERAKLENALAELEKAEKIMKECPNSFSERGKDQFLLNSDIFWQYKKALEDQKIVKKVEIQRIWENIKVGDDAFVFYCLESPFEVSLEEGGIPWEELGEELPEIETTESVKVYCETEIPVGSVMDNSEDIAQRLINEMEKIGKEMDKIIEEIPKEIANAQQLSPLITTMLSNDCTNCSQWCECDCRVACCGIEECSPCCVLAQPCRGISCPEVRAQIENTNQKIQRNHTKITDAFNNITVFDDEIHNLIEGNEIHDLTKIATPLPDGMREPTWAYRIINTEIPDIRIKFGDPVRGCFNTAEDWMRAIFEAKILEKTVLTCEEAKVICWDLPENYQCYGEGDPKAYTNYFCGEVLTP